MGPALGFDVEIVERQVHQHRLAAPYAAPEIDAARRFFLAKQLLEEASVLASGIATEAIQRLDGTLLVFVRLQFARRNQRGIGLTDGPHRRPLPVRWAASLASACR
jgi:hypothetical protein